MGTVTFLNCHKGLAKYLVQCQVFPPEVCFLTFRTPSFAAALCTRFAAVSLRMSCLRQRPQQLSGD